MTTKKTTFSKARSTPFNIDKLKSKYEKSSKKSGGKNDKEKDARFWTLTVDADQVGEATLRFLPGLVAIDSEDGETTPYVEKLFHAFRGVNGFMFEICPNMLGKPCPICKANSELYNKGDTESKNLASTRKKQKKYISNVLVLNDKGNPENNGKVFMFEYGQDIFKRLFAQLDVEVPEDEDEVTLPQVVPFMIDGTGADFILESHEEKDYRKYTKSRYKKPNAVKLSDSDLEEVLSQQYDLVDYINKEVIPNIKTDSQLEERLYKVTKVKEDLPQTAEDDTVSESSDDTEAEDINVDIDADDMDAKINAILGGN